MITYILILVHLISDFLFQPTKLVNWKKVSDMGVFVHISILFVVGLVLMAPFLNQILAWEFLLILAVTHYIQDKIKVWYEERYNKKKKFYPFLLDQMLHIGIIVAIANYLNNHLRFPVFESSFLKSIYYNEHVFVYLSLLILFSYALDITVFQWRLRKNPKLKYKRDYNSISKRVFAFALLYAIFLLLIYFS